MMMRRAKPAAEVPVWIGGPHPTFGNLTSSRGGLWVSSLRDDGLTRLTRIHYPIIGVCYGYSGAQTYGFAGSGSTAYRKIDRETGATLSTLAFSSTETTYSLKQVLEDRIILVKSTSPAAVYSLEWDGTLTQLPDDAVPASLRSRIGTIDGKAAFFVAGSAAANDGRGTMHVRSPSAVNGGIDYDCYGVRSSGVPANNPQYLAVVDSASGAVTVKDFEVPAEFDPPVVDGPLYSRDDATTFSAVAYNVDGGILVFGRHVANAYYWDGTKRTASQVNTSQRVSYEATVGVAHKTTDFLARIDASGAFSVVATLSRTAWWYDYQDVALTGADLAIVSAIWWYGKYNTPRVRNYDPGNFSGIGAAAAFEPGFANSNAAALTWELPDATYVDKELNSIVVTMSGAYYRLSSSGATFLDVPIPAGSGGTVGILQREKAWILRRTSGSGETYELSYATGQAFVSRGVLTSDDFSRDNPDQFELI
jgi:hypothetical protein